jgi:uncharacterized protein (DUF1684 family)
MNYIEQIVSLRKIREEEINTIKTTYGEEKEKFEYYPIDEKWKIPAIITLRKPKNPILDFENIYEKIGVAKVEFFKQAYPFTLFKLQNEENKYYICLRDGTSGKTTYPVGRIIPILKEQENFYAECNLAFAPVCGHLTKVVSCPMISDSLAIAIEAGEIATHKD